MKKIALTTLLAIVGVASAQQDPCNYHGGAPLPSYCSSQSYDRYDSGTQAAPVYQTPTYQGPRGGWDNRGWNNRGWDNRSDYAPEYAPAVQPYLYGQWDDWDGERVNLYVDNVLVRRNVYRSDVGRIVIRQPGRHLIQVVPVGYSYEQPIFTRYYDAPRSDASLSFSFGGNFNIILR